MLIFRHGAHSIYQGSRRAEQLVEHLRSLTGNQMLGDPEAAAVHAPPSVVHSVDGFPTESPAVAEQAVLELSAKSFAEDLKAYPLIFVLFYDAQMVRNPFLLQNFTQAAEALADHRVAAKFGWMQVSRHDDAESWLISKRYGVNELPDIKIFHNGRPSDYQAGADALDLIDVARWNAGAHMQRPPTSRVVEVEGPRGFDLALEKEALLLVAFTTRWCTRCLMLAAEFDAASTLLAAADPPVTLGTINLDDPRNRALVERFGVLSFPVGKYFYQGRFMGDFMGGSLAHEIVAEMLTIRDSLMLAEGASRKDEL